MRSVSVTGIPHLAFESDATAFDKFRSFQKSARRALRVGNSETFWQIVNLTVGLDSDMPTSGGTARLCANAEHPG